MGRASRVMLLATTVVAAAAGYALRRTEVQGHSMEPTLGPGDYLVTSRRFGAPARGDIVIAAHPHRPGMDLIKRVVGLPSEEVVIEGGKVTIDGKPLIEPWANGETRPEGRWSLGPNEIFLLGDNRAGSLGDGRTTGPIPADHASRRVIWRYWPPAKWGPV